MDVGTVGAAAAETLRVPVAVDLAAVVVGALTGGLRVLSVWCGWEAPVAVDLPRRARSRLGRRRGRGRPPAGGAPGTR